MEVADDAQFCVKLLYDKFGSLKVCPRVAATTLRTYNVVAWVEGVSWLVFSVCSTAHQVPMYNVILSILPTISVMVLLKLLDIAIEQSQPEVFTCASAAGGGCDQPGSRAWGAFRVVQLSRTSARAVFKDRIKSVGTARRRKKRTCCTSTGAVAMLPRTVEPSASSLCVARLGTEGTHESDAAAVLLSGAPTDDVRLPHGDMAAHGC